MNIRHTLIISLLFGLALQLQAQTRPYATLGFGWPEGMVIGMKVPTGSCTVGLAVGGLHGLKTLSTDLAYHFGGKAKEASLRPWYVRMPVIFNRYIDDDFKNPENALRSGLRFGYAFFATHQIGIQLEAGVGYVLFDEQKEELFKNNSSGFEPHLNATVFLRL